MTEPKNELPRCPKCNGPLQTFQKLDSDDKIVAEKQVCKNNFLNKRKKGCGYTRVIK